MGLDLSQGHPKGGLRAPQPGRSQRALAWDLDEDLAMDAPESSPCNRICQLAPGGVACLGCGRSSAEIAGWMGLGNEARRAVKALAAKRLEALQAAGIIPRDG